MPKSSHLHPRITKKAATRAQAQVRDLTHPREFVSCLQRLYELLPEDQRPPDYKKDLSTRRKAEKEQRQHYQWLRDDTIIDVRRVDFHSLTERLSRFGFLLLRDVLNDQRCLTELQRLEGLAKVGLEMGEPFPAEPDEKPGTTIQRRRKGAQRELHSILRGLFTALVAGRPAEVTPPQRRTKKRPGNRDAQQARRSIIYRDMLWQIYQESTGSIPPGDVKGRGRIAREIAKTARRRGGDAKYEGIRLFLEDVKKSLVV